VTFQTLDGGLALPGDPLRSRPASFDMAAVLEAGRLQAEYLNHASGRPVAGGRLLAALLARNHVTLQDLGTL